MSRWTLRIGGIVAALSLFLASMYVSYVYASQPAIAPISQVGAVTESLATTTFSAVKLLAQSAILVDTTTLVTEYQLHPDVQLPLASLTKVPLVLAVAEVLPLDMRVTIHRDTAPSSKADRLRAGSRWLTRDLMTYTLVASSNDGAEILAQTADESLRQKYPSLKGRIAAVARMNDLVKELDLSTVYFLNPSGLDESATQAGAYGSARDIATLFSYAARTLPDIFTATTKSKIEIASEDGAIATAINTDDVLDSLNGVVMGKTGYTDLAGGNLVIVFDAHGHRYVAVVLGSTKQGRFTDMQQLVTAVAAGHLVVN